eukprot:Protomagalhaensia_wolfi_Nauph_80__4576@NODE_4708_length_520_cov_2524_413721_g3790_i0_p1_GENE_NODE_4708_length_520_cov_2524_413721_g3790_i0NODE_4708_length_520_cov_2524_413721_g3790_i0_p1_ORF_typecomplete_len134_score18_23ADH_N/PF08240_12/3_6e27NADH_4Fe4S/PF10589_9/0_72_NODE_4708_length_520_cov_2524_413721_g3790_i039440
MPIPCRAYAVMKAGGTPEPFEYDLPEVRPNDVLIEVWYAGMCQSDIGFSSDAYGEPGKYPMVPGWDLSGSVFQVGSEVTEFKVGDRVGTGCYAERCGKCRECQQGKNQYCPKGVPIYGGTRSDGGTTYGGYGQ